MKSAMLIMMAAGCLSRSTTNRSSPVHRAVNEFTEVGLGVFIGDVAGQWRGLLYLDHMITVVGRFYNQARGSECGHLRL